MHSLNIYCLQKFKMPFVFKVRCVFNVVSKIFTNFPSFLSRCIKVVDVFRRSSRTPANPGSDMTKKKKKKKKPLHTSAFSLRLQHEFFNHF